MAWVDSLDPPLPPRLASTMACPSDGNFCCQECREPWGGGGAGCGGRGPQGGGGGGLPVTWPMNNKNSMGNLGHQRKVLVGCTRIPVTVVWCLPPPPGGGLSFGHCPPPPPPHTPGGGWTVGGGGVLEHREHGGVLGFSYTRTPHVPTLLPRPESGGCYIALRPPPPRRSCAGAPAGALFMHRDGGCSTVQWPQWRTRVTRGPADPRGVVAHRVPACKPPPPRRCRNRGPSSPWSLRARPCLSTASPSDHCFPDSLPCSL